MMYAGDLAGIHKDYTGSDRATALSLTLNVQNLRNSAVGCFYGYADDYAKVAPFMKKTQATLDKWSKYLGNKNYLMSADGDVCVADFHLAEMTFQLLSFSKSFDMKSDYDGEQLDIKKNLLRHAERVFNLNGIERMERKMDLPINNKVAKWGKTYDEDFSVPYKMLSGVYTEDDDGDV